MSTTTQQPQPQVVYQQSPMPPLGVLPQNLVCPSCHSSITTKVDTEANTKTHLFALLLCVCGCICCVCVPYCMDSCQSQKHSCPSCGAYLGTHQS